MQIHPNSLANLKRGAIVQRGKPAWNKGKKMPPHTQEWKDKVSAIHKKSGLTPPNRKGIMGKDHGSWKGDEVGYTGVHAWIRKELGTPRFCEHCGNRNLNHRQYHWANISGLYKRILTDWQRLCVKCHMKFDTDCGRGKQKKPKNI